MSQALGSDDLTLDQSATSIQIILPEPRSHDTLLIKLRLYYVCLLFFKFHELVTLNLYFNDLFSVSLQT